MHHDAPNTAAADDEPARLAFSRYRTCRTSAEEDIARNVATEAIADVRTVRRELAFPGAVRGALGRRIRAALAARFLPAPGRSSAA